ncbi:hypothetical protein OF001_U250021 [Pseudomonas sp. OF001]|nr:hypothetical protein OF001_U250021 [Pseudomonas sp. OF001]
MLPGRAHGACLGAPSEPADRQLASPAHRKQPAAAAMGCRIRVYYQSHSENLLDGSAAGRQD